MVNTNIDELDEESTDVSGMRITEPGNEGDELEEAEVGAELKEETEEGAEETPEQALDEQSLIDEGPEAASLDEADDLEQV